MKIKNEKEIFDLFVANERSLADVLKTPFIQDNDGRVCASDGFIVIMVNPDCVSGEYEIRDFGPKSPLRGYNCDKPLLVSDLQDALRRCPQVPEMKIIDTNVVQCPECEGTGEVTAEYVADYDDEEYDIECTCPICDGEGTIEEEVKEPTGNTIPDKACIIKFGKGYYPWYYIDTIIKTCEMLNIEKVKLVRTSKSDLSIIELSSDIHIGLMPLVGFLLNGKLLPAIDVKFTE